MMSHERMGRKIAKLLGSHPDLAFELYCMASEIVDDFEDYGPAIQSDENGEYGDTTIIGRLRHARNQLIVLIRED